MPTSKGFPLPGSCSVFIEGMVGMKKKKGRRQLAESEGKWVKRLERAFREKVRKGDYCLPVFKISVALTYYNLCISIMIVI